MENNFYEQERLQEQGFVGLSLGKYTAKTFLIMFFGLLLTFGTALFLTQTYPGLYLLVSAAEVIPAFHIILLVAQLVVVLLMSARLERMSPTGAAVCFAVYSVLTGITFTVYFIIFEMYSLILVFGATALYFGGMAVFGYVTNIDMSRIRSILLGGLIFLILFNVLMLFIPGLEVLDRVVCTIGVVIFLAYTAYDTQKVKQFYYAFQGDEAMLKKASILSALELYLDFVNLFIYLLRILGKRKN